MNGNLCISLLIFKTWFTIIRSSKKRKNTTSSFKVDIWSLKDLPALRHFDSPVSDQEIICISPWPITLKSRLFSISFQILHNSTSNHFSISPLLTPPSPCPLALSDHSLGCCTSGTWLCSECFSNSTSSSKSLLLWKFLKTLWQN